MFGIVVVRVSLSFHFFILPSADQNFDCYESRQIYVELERARLVRRLAKIKEEQGLVAEAAELMQEIAVC